MVLVEKIERNGTVYYRFYVERNGRKEKIVTTNKEWAEEVARAKKVLIDEKGFIHYIAPSYSSGGIIDVSNFKGRKRTPQEQSAISSAIEKLRQSYREQLDKLKKEGYIVFTKKEWEKIANKSAYAREIEKGRVILVPDLETYVKEGLKNVEIKKVTKIPKGTIAVKTSRGTMLVRSIGQASVRKEELPKILEGKIEVSGKEYKVPFKLVEKSSGIYIYKPDISKLPEKVRKEIEAKKLTEEEINKMIGKEAFPTLSKVVPAEWLGKAVRMTEYREGEPAHVQIAKGLGNIVVETILSGAEIFASSVKTLWDIGWYAGKRDWVSLKKSTDAYLSEMKRFGEGIVSGFVETGKGAIELKPYYLAQAGAMLIPVGRLRIKGNFKMPILSKPKYKIASSVSKLMKEIVPRRFEYEIEKPKYIFDITKEKPSFAVPEGIKSQVVKIFYYQKEPKIVRGWKWFGKTFRKRTIGGGEFFKEADILLTHAKKKGLVVDVTDLPSAPELFTEVKKPPLYRAVFGKNIREVEKGMVKRFEEILNLRGFTREYGIPTRNIIREFIYGKKSEIKPYHFRMFEIPKYEGFRLLEPPKKLKFTKPDVSGFPKERKIISASDIIGKEELSGEIVSRKGLLQKVVPKLKEKTKVKTKIKEKIKTKEKLKVATDISFRRLGLKLKLGRIFKHPTKFFVLFPVKFKIKQKTGTPLAFSFKFMLPEKQKIGEKTEFKLKFKIPELEKTLPALVLLRPTLILAKEKTLTLKKTSLLLRQKLAFENLSLPKTTGKGYFESISLDISKEISRAFKYMPDILSEITGLRTKKRKKLLTGLEIRPVLVRK